MLETHYVFLLASLLVLVSIFSSKLSERFGVPALLMFLIIGMLAGSDGPGGIYFDNAAMATAVGTFALAYILFSGGLDTNWQSIRPVLGRGLILSTLGVAITAAMVGVFTWAVMDFTIAEGLLLGAIVSSTDAAAVFSVLRSRSVGLKGNLKPLLELESGSNDPMAVFLTIGLLQLHANSQASWMTLVWGFFLQMSCGAAVGLALGKITAWLLNRIRLDYEGLYPVLSMSIVILAYGASESLGGNGFLSVYLCGVVLGNSDFPYKRSLMRFHDGLGWLMQIGMFLLLGMLVFPSHLPSVVFPGILIALFLLFIARPVAVFIGLFRSGLHWREKTLVAWAGLRGAVPIVLATFPLMVGYPKSEQIFNLVFFIVLASVLLQGKSLMMLARWLKLDQSLKRHPRSPLEFDRTTATRNETREFEVLPGSVTIGKSISEIGLPKDVLILLIRRGPDFVVPRGHTRLEPYDMLMVLAEPEGLHATRMRLLEQAPPPAEDPAEA